MLWHNPCTRLTWNLLYMEGPDTLDFLQKSDRDMFKR
jgi:hypothetical protein